MKRTILLFMSLAMVSHSYASEGVKVDFLKSKSFSMTAYVGNPAYLSAYHEAQIKNDSDVIKVVNMKYELCVRFKNCESRHAKIKINPHSTWHDHINTHMMRTFHFRGSYQIVATTSVSGDATGSYESFASVSVR